VREAVNGEPVLGKKHASGDSPRTRIFGPVGKGSDKRNNLLYGCDGWVVGTGPV
jgi:hypothetical protein